MAKSVKQSAEEAKVLWAEKAAAMSVEQLELEKAEAWAMFSLVSRGSSAKAVEVQWARYSALNAEIQNRKAGK